MPDTVLIHSRIDIRRAIAIRSNVLNIEASIPAAIPVGNTVLDEIQPNGEVQALAPIKVGREGRIEEGPVDGHLEQSTLRLTINGLGVRACSIPEVVDVVPLLSRAAIDEIRNRVKD